MESFAWMAWTWQTATFFAVIATILVAMTVWEFVSPSSDRVGILRIRTTRGDRLFISLLGAAFIHLAWLGLIGPDAGLYWASLISLAYAVAVFRMV